jgi:hypothetical protein
MTTFVVMDETYDIDGRLIQIGDTVEWYHREGVDYTFTVERIEINGIWGEDIPDAYCMDWGTGLPDYDSPNWHISTYSKVIKRKEKTPWEGSTLKFNFI